MRTREKRAHKRKLVYTQASAQESSHIPPKHLSMQLLKIHAFLEVSSFHKQAKEQLCIGLVPKDHDIFQPNIRLKVLKMLPYILFPKTSIFA